MLGWLPAAGAAAGCESPLFVRWDGCRSRGSLPSTDWLQKILFPVPGAAFPWFLGCVRFPPCASGAVRPKRLWPRRAGRGDKMGAFFQLVPRVRRGQAPGVLRVGAPSLGLRTPPFSALSPAPERATPGGKNVPSGAATRAGYFWPGPLAKNGRIWYNDARPTLAAAAEKGTLPWGRFGPASCGAQFAAGRPAGRRHPGGNSAAPPGENLPRGLGLFSPEARTRETTGPAWGRDRVQLPVPPGGPGSGLSMPLPERSFDPCSCPNRSAWRAAP